MEKKSVSQKECDDVRVFTERCNVIRNSNHVFKTSDGREENKAPTDKRMLQ